MKRPVYVGAIICLKFKILAFRQFVFPEDTQNILRVEKKTKFL